MLINRINRTEGWAPPRNILTSLQLQNSKSNFLWRVESLIIFIFMLYECMYILNYISCVIFRSQENKLTPYRSICWNNPNRKQHLFVSNSFLIYIFMFTETQMLLQFTKLNKTLSGLTKIRRWLLQSSSKRQTGLEGPVRISVCICF